MENRIMLTAPAANAVQSLRKLLETSRQMAAPAEKALRRLSGYYSDVLERPVGLRETRDLLWAQLTFFAGIMPADYPLLLRTVLLALTVKAVMRCRRLL